MELNDEINNPGSEYSYVGKCRKCGAICAAVIDDPERKSTAERVADMISSGLIVERVESMYVRKMFSECKCNAKQQPELFKGKP